MDFSEDVTRGFCGTAEATDHEAIDQEFVEKRDDRCECVLEVSNDDVVVERIDVKAVPKQGDRDGVFFLTFVENETSDKTKDKRAD